MAKRAFNAKTAKSAKGAKEEFEMKTLWWVGLMSLLLAACSATPSPTPAPTKVVLASPTATATPHPTQTATATHTSTPTLTQDPAIEVIYSPNGVYVAKTYAEYSHPSKQQIIEIFSSSGDFLWSLPYQADMPVDDPRVSLRIYKWSLDSSDLYFYYSFSYDGAPTLWDGFNLQKFDTVTQGISNVISSDGLISFTLSRDEKLMAYARAQDEPRSIFIRNLETGEERSINIDMQTEDYIQVGWIFWAPENQKLVFHTMVKERIQAFHLDTQDLEQKALLEFWSEEYWFNQWAVDGNPSYLKYDTNEIIVINAQDNSISVLGTVTPKP